MEQVFVSESSSGCESGWTLYLMYPSNSLQNHNSNQHHFICNSFTHEEDMSMVSDASSGPQHFTEQEDECFKFSNNGGAGGKTPTKEEEEDDEKKKINDMPFNFLDDTASSSFFSFSNNNLTVPSSKKASVVENKIVDYSEEYSTNYYYYNINGSI